MNNSSHKPNITKTMLLLIVVVFFSIAVAEIALSLLGQKSYYTGDPELDNLVPAKFWISDEKGSYFDKSAIDSYPFPRLKILNSQGFGDIDEFVYTEELAKKYRILVLGDSFTWGASANLDNSFVEIIENELKKSASIELWNAATPATGTKQAVKTLKHIFPIMKPNLVILGFFVNDFDDNLYPLNMYTRRKDFTAIHMYDLDSDFNPVRLSYQDAFKRAIGVAPASEVPYWLYLLRRTKVYSISEKSIKSLKKHYSLKESKQEEWRKSLEITGQLLTELRDNVNNNGASFIVILIPSRHDIVKEGKELLAARTLMQQMGIQYLNVLSHLEKSDYRPPPDPHWNNKGHIKVGKLLLSNIKELMRKNHFLMPR